MNRHPDWQFSPGGCFQLIETFCYSILKPVFTVETWGDYGTVCYIGFSLE